MGKITISSPFILLAIASLFAVAEGLQCYHCIARADEPSDPEASCNYEHEVNSSLLTNCTQKDPICYLLYTTRHKEKKEVPVTSRGCLPPLTGEFEKSQPGCFDPTYKQLAGISGLEITMQDLDNKFGPVPESTVARFCYCKGDGCNHANLMNGADKMWMLGTLAMLVSMT